MRDEKNTDIAVAEDLKPILEVLGNDDAKAVAVLRDELVDNWKKKQIFRTETEMRISVLNDAKHPTDASKYWQSVREMSAMFDALMGLSFDLRKNDLKQEKLQIKILKADDTWKNIPVIVITSKDLTEADNSFLTKNVDRVIQKGKYTRKELISRINEAVKESNIKMLKKGN